MNKKGFTLVELLAVIAILAILVIVAMPNVLKRFNAAKKSSFVTEVRTVIKEAQSQFVQDKITKSGSVMYDSDSTTNDATALDMSGSAKNYRITMDTNGNITSIIVYDGNYCWSKEGTNIVGTDVQDSGVYDVDDDEQLTNPTDSTKTATCVAASN